MQDELRSCPGIPQVHEQVPGLLDDPGLDRVLRGAQDPDAPVAVLDHRKGVYLRAIEQVSGEEVQRQDPLRLRPQELRPPRAVPAGAGSIPASLRICHTERHSLIAHHRFAWVADKFVGAVWENQRVAPVSQEAAAWRDCGEAYRRNEPTAAGQRWHPGEADQLGPADEVGGSEHGLDPGAGCVPGPAGHRRPAA